MSGSKSKRYSELNLEYPKHIRSLYGLSEKQFVDMCVKGKIKLFSKTKFPMVILDSIANSFYEHRENVVLKLWKYDYEDINEKHEKMKKYLFRFPKCFFRNEWNIPVGYYKVFYKRAMLKVCIFVMEDFIRGICFNWDNENDLEIIYNAFLEGKVDIED